MTFDAQDGYTNFLSSMDSRIGVPNTKLESVSRQTNEQPAETSNPKPSDDNQQKSDTVAIPQPQQPPAVLLPKTSEQMLRIRYIVQEAKHQKKTFTVKGCFPTIRKALLDRGWVECFDDDQIKGKEMLFTLANRQKLEGPVSFKLKNPSLRLHESERAIASQMLHGHDVDFYWSMRHATIDWPNKNKIINRFTRLPFTSKEGLCLILQNCRWFNEPGLSEVKFPRCYAMNYEDQSSAFIQDFQLTACVSLLRWFSELHKQGATERLSSEKGNIPSTTIFFAMERCNEYVTSKEHFDVDLKMNHIWEDDWSSFYRDFHLLVNGKDTFTLNLDVRETGMPRLVNNTLRSVEAHLPQAHLDGIHNLWILKPGNKCRGRDIQIISKLEDALKYTNSKLKYVAQKYIERPLLIYNTKFDIRQWFLVTSIYPLSVWMYRDCYLRFSSKPFSLNDLHESVHLTNHAVQHKYRTVKFHNELPDDNMWESKTFKAYLHSLGKGDVWYSKIYPGMRECVVGALLASQDGMERRPNTFELFGADFMIASDFSPWLIEINSCPAMCNTTSVTRKMCPQCFEDIIKVIIDRRTDPNADTGNFHLVYKQEKFHKPPHLVAPKPVKPEKPLKKSTSTEKFEKVVKPSIPLYLNDGSTSSLSSSRSKDCYYPKYNHQSGQTYKYNPDFFEEKEKRFLLEKSLRLGYSPNQREVLSDIDFTPRDRFSYGKQLSLGKEGRYINEKEKDVLERLDKFGSGVRRKTETSNPIERISDYQKQYDIEKLIEINKRSFVTSENNFNRNSRTAKEIIRKKARISKSARASKEKASSKDTNTGKIKNAVTKDSGVGKNKNMDNTKDASEVEETRVANIGRDTYASKDSNLGKDTRINKDTNKTKEKPLAKDTSVAKDTSIAKDNHEKKARSAKENSRVTTSKKDTNPSADRNVLGGMDFFSNIIPLDETLISKELNNTKIRSKRTSSPNEISSGTTKYRKTTPSKGIRKRERNQTSAQRQLSPETRANQKNTSQNSPKAK